MKKINWEKWIRRVKWGTFKSDTIWLGVEHFLAMIPATILVPITINNAFGGQEVIDTALVLFTSGLGTALFTLFSTLALRIIVEAKKRKGEIVTITTGIPAYLGSSFAYIALTINLIKLLQSQIDGCTAELAYTYLRWAFVFSGFLLVILAFLFFFVPKIEQLFSICFPASVIGPAISLIGLELSSNAVHDSTINVVTGKFDWNYVSVALLTLMVIVLLSLLKRRFMKNASIVIGVVIGYVVYSSFYPMSLPAWSIADIWEMPRFNFHFADVPPNLPQLLPFVIPATLIVFSENISRITVISRMQNSDIEQAEIFNEHSVEIMGCSLLSHGLSSMVATMIGSVPNTLYAENIAVMSIHKTKEAQNEPDWFIRKMTGPYSVYPYLLASAMAILFAFVKPLHNLLLNLPRPVIGGMELFLFGIISAPGIQLLVEQRVNYEKVSNQIITASVLITGIGDISIQVNTFELSGMSLGLLVGFAINFCIIILRQLGVLCDTMTMDEVLAQILPLIKDKNVKVVIPQAIEGYNYFTVTELDDSINKFSKIIEKDKKIHAEFIRDVIAHATEINITTDNPSIRIRKKVNSICIDFRQELLNQETVDIYLRDYQDAIDSDHKTTDPNSIHYLAINLSRSIPFYKVLKLVQIMDLPVCESAQTESETK